MSESSIFRFGTNYLPKSQIYAASWVVAGSYKSTITIYLKNGLKFENTVHTSDGNRILADLRVVIEENERRLTEDDTTMPEYLNVETNFS